MARAKTPKQLEIKIKSLKKQVGKLETRRKKAVAEAMKKEAKKKVVKKRTVKRKPARKKAVKRKRRR